jgi:DNA polymerase-1
VKAEALFKKHGYAWKTVEDAFVKAGLTQDDAILQARMARSLRADDWDFKQDKMILWKP